MGWMTYTWAGYSPFPSPRRVPSVLCVGELTLHSSDFLPARRLTGNQVLPARCASVGFGWQKWAGPFSYRPVSNHWQDGRGGAKFSCNTVPG